MSSTSRYNFVFVLPNSIRNIPIPFEDFKKPLDEDGNEQGFYTYDEYMELPGNGAIYTPSGTHALLSHNITTIDFKEEFQSYIDVYAQDIILMSGVKVENWQDEDQSNHLWVLTTDKSKPEYNYDTFREQSPLFVPQIVEE